MIPALAAAERNISFAAEEINDKDRTKDTGLNSLCLFYFIGKYEIDGFLEKENPLKSGHENQTIQDQKI